MTLIEILIIAVGLIVVGVVVLFAIVFARLGDLGRQVDMLFDLYTDQGEAYTQLADKIANVATTLDILLREHAELTNQVRDWDRALAGPYARAVGELSRIRTHDTTIVQRGRQ